MSAPPRNSDPAPRRIRVDLGERGYDVLIGRGLLPRLGELMGRVYNTPPAQMFLVRDTGLPASAAAAAAASLNATGASLTSDAITPSERDKTITTVVRLMQSVLRSRHDRSQPIIALGGGVTGDVVGFLAAIYRRGVPVVQCPTTLLAMVDAAVGGKTGVNVETNDGGLLKNMAGVIHQPVLVVADVDTLASLSDRHFRAGLAECVKHGLIAGEFGDPGLFEWTERSLDAILRREPDALIELVARNVALKARVVESDEREELTAAGGRALLNLGHTFGHAIEPIAALSPTGLAADAPLLHGEAVALGLAAACRCGELMGATPAELAARVTAALLRIGLPTAVAGLPEDATLLAAMAHDKKATSHFLRIVLPIGGWRAMVVENPPTDAVVAGVASIRRRPAAGVKPE